MELKLGFLGENIYIGQADGNLIKNVKRIVMKYSVDFDGRPLIDPETRMPMVDEQGNPMLIISGDHPIDLMFLKDNYNGIIEINIKIDKFDFVIDINRIQKDVSDGLKATYNHLTSKIIQINGKH